MNNDVIDNVLADLRRQLTVVYDDLDWHYKRIKEGETKALNLKNTIGELESLKMSTKNDS